MAQTIYQVQNINSGDFNGITLYLCEKKQYGTVYFFQCSKYRYLIEIGKKQLLKYDETPLKRRCHERDYTQSLQSFCQALVDVCYYSVLKNKDS